MLKAVSEEEKREQRVTCGGRNSGAEIDPFGLVHARILGLGSEELGEKVLL